MAKAATKKASKEAALESSREALEVISKKGGIQGAIATDALKAIDWENIK